MDYLLVAVLSSIEQEYPVSVFLGWTTHRQPGLRRDNWSLVEAALVDGRTGRPLVQAEGVPWRRWTVRLRRGFHNGIR